jgi:hypothetical protein
MALVGFSFRAVSSARLVPSAVVESWAAACVLGAQEGVAASLLMHSAVSSAQDSGAALPSFPLCLRPLLRLGRRREIGHSAPVMLCDCSETYEARLWQECMAGRIGQNLLVRDGNRAAGKEAGV